MAVVWIILLAPVPTVKVASNVPSVFRRAIGFIVVPIYKVKLTAIITYLSLFQSSVQSAIGIQAGNTVYDCSVIVGEKPRDNNLPITLKSRSLDSIVCTIPKTKAEVGGDKGGVVGTCLRMR